MLKRDHLKLSYFQRQSTTLIYGSLSRQARQNEVQHVACDGKLRVGIQLMRRSFLRMLTKYELDYLSKYYYQLAMIEQG